MAKELKIRITGDASGLQKGTKDAEGILSGFGSKVSAWSVAAGTLLADGIKTGVSAAIGFIGDSIGAATDINETISKVGVLFGDAAGEIEAFAATAATGLGQSRQQAMDAAATFATFGKGAGLSGSALADFSTDLTVLASDMASFSNTSPEQAIGAIGAALRGESEPIRAYGVLLDDATLRQKALELGITSTTKDALTPQQKVLAAQAAIFDQTSAAQGDFARTSGGLANQQRILAAQVENLKARLGQALLPVVQRLVTFINTTVIPVLSAWAEKYGPAVERALAGIAGWVTKLTGLFRSGGWSAALGEIGKKLVDVWMWAADWLYTSALPAVGRALLAIGKKFGTWITETAVPYLQANMPIWLAALGSWLETTAIPWLGEKSRQLASLLGGWISQAVGYLWENLPGWIAAFADWYYGTALPWVAGKMGELAVKLGDWIVQGAQSLRDNLPTWIGAFVEWAVGTALPTILEKAAEWQLKIVEWVAQAAIDLAVKLPEWIAAFNTWAASEALPALLQFGKDLLAKLGEGVAGANDFLYDVGVNVVAGMIRGLQSMAGSLRSAATSLVADNIPGPVRDLLGISSPSKVFHQIGMQTAQGLAGGMLAGTGMVQAASGRLAGAALPSGPSFSAQRSYGQADLSGGELWSPARQTVIVEIDGRQVVMATARPAEFVHRAGR